MEVRACVTVDVRVRALVTVAVFVTTLTLALALTSRFSTLASATGAARAVAKKRLAARWRMEGIVLYCLVLVEAREGIELLK